jgi:hypothetical protein
VIGVEGTKKMSGVGRVVKLFSRNQINKDKKDRVKMKW